MMKRLFLTWCCLVGCRAIAWGQLSYTISKGTISLAVTKNYLSRSVMLTGLAEMYPYHCWGCEAINPQTGQPGPGQDFEKRLRERLLFKRFVAMTKPKMILGTNCWDYQQYTLKQDCNTHFANCQLLAQEMHALDPDIIMGASLDEIISKEIRATGQATDIVIPGAGGLGEVLAAYNACLQRVNAAHPEYGFPPAITGGTTSAARGEQFDWRNIGLPVADSAGKKLNPGGIPDNFVDIARDQAQLWYFYLAKNYIDTGFEMLRLGQITVTGKNDSNYKRTFQLAQVIREYAKGHARRGIVLLEEQVATTYCQLSKSKRVCIFDVCGLPLRLYSVPRRPVENALLDERTARPDYLPHDVTTYQGAGLPDWMHCPGGGTYYWGTVAQLPIYTELDNTGDQMWATLDSSPAAHPPVPNRSGTGYGFPWGWDECSWFYNQPVEYEKQWLTFIASRIKCLTNGNAAFCMPGRRIYAFKDQDNVLHQGAFDAFRDVAGPDLTAVACDGITVTTAGPPPSSDSKPLAATIQQVWAAADTASGGPCPASALQALPSAPGPRKTSSAGM